MTRTRRILTLIDLAVAIPVGGALPASACFSETVAVPTPVLTC